MRFLRFNLRTLLMTTLVVGLTLGVAGRSWRYYQRQEAVAVQLRILARAAIVDHPENPGLSQRVWLLPALGEEVLYQKFHLDEPWDSPHNSQLIPEMPAIYRTPDSQLAPGWTTLFIYSIRDNQAIVETADGLATPWTKPANEEVQDIDVVAWVETWDPSIRNRLIMRIGE